jgi:hypothetical protein
MLFLIRFRISVTSWNRVLLEQLIVRSANQEIPRLLWNPKVHYGVHKRPLPAPILSQMNRVHTLQTCFYKIHFNIILPSTSRSFELCLPFRLSNQNFVRISYLYLAQYMPCPSHPPSFYHPNNIWWRVQIMELLLILRYEMAACRRDFTFLWNAFKLINTIGKRKKHSLVVFRFLFTSKWAMMVFLNISTLLVKIECSNVSFDFTWCVSVVLKSDLEEQILCDFSRSILKLRISACWRNTSTYAFEVNGKGAGYSPGL